MSPSPYCGAIVSIAIPQSVGLLRQMSRSRCPRRPPIASNRENDERAARTGKTVVHCACAILRSGNTGRYGRMARGGAKTSGLYRRSLSAFSTPASRKGRHRRSVPRTNSLIRHQRRNILQEALHRLQELIKVAVAVEVDLEGIATRCEKGAACYPRPLGSVIRQARSWTATARLPASAKNSGQRGAPGTLRRLARPGGVGWSVLSGE